MKEVILTLTHIADTLLNLSPRGSMVYDKLEKCKVSLAELQNDDNPQEDNLYKAVDECEKQLIIKVLFKCKNNRSADAEVMGLDRKTLYNKLKRYDLQ